MLCFALLYRAMLCCAVRPCLQKKINSFILCAPIIVRKYYLITLHRRLTIFYSLGARSLARFLVVLLSIFFSVWRDIGPWTSENHTENKKKFDKIECAPIFSHTRTNELTNSDCWLWNGFWLRKKNKHLFFFYCCCRLYCCCFVIFIYFFFAFPPCVCVCLFFASFHRFHQTNRDI